MTVTQRNVYYFLTSSTIINWFICEVGSSLCFVLSDLIPDKMCVRYLGFLLVWFPGVLNAQSAAQSCRAPRLNGGYLVPEKEAYFHGMTLSYGCDDGLKPAVEGWWATSTCQNGSWSHEPQCIDENACMPPTIPNAKYSANTNGWYKHEQTIRITCDEGYDYKDLDATAKCINGTWSSVPVCEKSIYACGEPPKIPHAVIIHQTYKELYPVNSEVQYECEDEYTLDGAGTEKSVYCISGNWSAGPTCIAGRETRPGTGQGGSEVGGTGGSRPGTGHGGSAGGGHTTSTGGGTKPVGGGSRPGTGHGGSAGGGHTTSTGGGTKPVGGGSRPGTGHGGSAGSASSSEEKETQLQITTITTCGNHPVVPNGDVVGNNPMFLRYQCAAFYKQTGPERVECYSNGKWSETPTCKPAFCSLDTGDYSELIPVGVKYIKDGEKARFECVHQDEWWTTHYSVVRCNNGRMRRSRCCDWWDLKRDIC
ncbi:sushi, von Willebrand factor type A, EGF and pentraxin domain-containing protein 1-like isoform X5 [Epinephelus fuscoguttatus]|uniref:sushi, von Willebrand factor type A, EGF and pentraxin domain-containing protein 1-like isoform X3 n=1 Tax=Epinephelus fuscoguttatus TaxID=293821 RepID=UPI0020D10F37|nr:sushi, von Willebrand factor type A, EGF and pentraxin domain-containing protein 1-like isoform X3 [Epinephelus fuscoguttatus]XP_049453917.1 sushi, von Willebrand factor type A, EGF and pentraxin domain-containing protein 1-like isoform X4 [Epinephelus fuscoguttatus]XP_049453918.1 sushi, von Willebrand factor type A, EGF and pentraxin domain-containing protein 1-like isoform X5 [Epinephelus fuscoguttatus]